MKTLYFECNMGAAGDMLLASLYELMPDQAEALRTLNEIGIPGVTYAAERTAKCGIVGTHMKVAVSGEEEGEGHPHAHGADHHAHGSLHGIEHIVANLQLPDESKQEIMDIYEMIAEAEGRVHGVSVKEVHFHELGAMDALADIAGTVVFMRKLGDCHVFASPICTGFGQTKCAHGLMPVPAPATALLLEGIPAYAGSISGELCTPTGAALLRHYVEKFISMPIMKTSRIGYGMGKKDFEAANCVRAFLNDDEPADDEILELSCNLDDMTGEHLAYAQEMLMKAGALDVFTTAIGMKKGRCGILLTCLCRPSDREHLIRTMFKHTSTIGIREKVCTRSVLRRSIVTKHTELGEIRCKLSEGYDVRRVKPEYEDLSKIAAENDLTLAEVEASLKED